MLPKPSTLLSSQDGAIAVIVAVMIGVLAGMMALSIDLGRLFNLDTQLQNAADAAALAGGSQLNTRAGARARAIAAATDVLVRNTQIFATDGAGTDVMITPADIKFLQDLVTRVEATDDTNANFIEVTVAPRTINYAFAGLLGAITMASPDARAVAGLGSAICKVPPLMICNPFESSTGGGSFDSDAHKGEGVQLKEGGPSSQWAPGNFGLLALDEVNLSTDDVRDAMGRVKPNALCFGLRGTVGTKPGQATAVAQGINTRFDIYEGKIKALADDSDYHPAKNPVKGLIKAGTQCSFNPNGGPGWTKPADTYEGPFDGAADAMGFPRDNCAYGAPNGPGGCVSGPTDGGRIGDGVWDVVTYMATNHPLLTWPSHAAYAPLKALADARPSGLPLRYEVYRWESGDLPSGSSTSYMVDNTISDPLNGEDAALQCNLTMDPPPVSPDRRLIAAAVVNCIEQGVKGQTDDVEVLTWIDLFMTEPMGVYDGNNDLYGEIVGFSDAGFNANQTNKDGVIHNVVQLYE